jgi:DNA-binding MarR family transcriptional regulator
MWTHYIKIVQLNRMGQYFMNCKLAEIGLSSGLFYLLLELNNHEGLSMSELSRAVGVDNAYGSRAISNLIDKGLVVKNPDPRDERAVCLSLTQSGKKAARKVDQAAREWISIITQGISMKEWETFMGVFDKLHANASERALCSQMEA